MRVNGERRLCFKRGLLAQKTCFFDGFTQTVYIRVLLVVTIGPLLPISPEMTLMKRQKRLLQNELLANDISDKSY